MKEYEVEISASKTVYVRADNESEAEERALESFWENVSDLEPEVKSIEEC